MPHLDAMCLPTPSIKKGESRFAKPVAAITDFVRRFAAKPFHGPGKPRIRQDLEVRALEEYFGRASDFADFERLERDYERRDCGGMRSWDWR
jgi:hypothetical protein